MDENYAKDARGWRLHIGDQVNMLGSEYLGEHIQKIIERCDNKLVYGGITIMQDATYGVLIPKGQEKFEQVFVLADAHKQFYNIELDRETIQGEKQKTVTQFLRTATMPAIVNAYNGEWGQ